MKTVTILVPCYNEEAVLEKFYARVQAVIKGIDDCTFDYVFVNDGSSDRTLEIMRELRRRDPQVHYVSLSRNFGKEAAMIAGLDQVVGDAVIIMDADLQDPPELVPEMIDWWKQGYKDVCAKRRSREGETWFKKWSSHTYYKLLQRMTDFQIQIDVGDFRLLDRQCIEALKLLREAQRYTKGMFSWIGFEKKEILFDRDARAAGRTKWNYWKLLNLALEGITSFTMIPLRIASFLGCLLATTAMLYMIFVVIKTLLYGDEVQGYPSMISVILFIGGVQIFFLGIIGEYLGRVFNESKRRPLYLISELDGEEVIKQRSRSDQ